MTNEQKLKWTILFITAIVWVISFIVSIVNDGFDRSGIDWIWISITGLVLGASALSIRKNGQK